jgi:hypothetical protein
MSQVEEKKPYLSVYFGEHGGHFDWMDATEALAWINQLRDHWSWMSKIRLAPVSQAWSAISSQLNSSIGHIQQAQSYQNQGQLPVAEGQLKSASFSLEKFIKPNLWLLPGNAQRSFVEGIKDAEKPQEAGLIVANWMNIDLSGAPIKQIVWALMQLDFYERGIKDRVKSESAALKRLAGDMQTALTGYQETERTQTSRFDSLHSQIAEQSSGQQAEFIAAQDTRNREWRAKIEETQSELDALKHIYDKHMSLAAPVEYWEGKRKKHRLLTVISFVAVVLSMLGVGFTLHSELQDIGKAVEANRVTVAAAKTMGNQTTKDSKQSPQTSSDASAHDATTDVRVSPSSQDLLQSAATWKIGSFVLLATLCFWFIRLLVRIFLSSLHLENDAAERVTMAKTYLALIRDSALPKGENISTVLAALFRPTGDGIVKDEGLPPTAMEWLTKLGGK